MLYTAFIADIKDSKKIMKNNREQIQIFIKSCLISLNSIFKKSLAFDVIFSAGDEIQGLFMTPVSAILYFRLLKMLLSPLQMRCGIGMGELDVLIPDGTSSEQDGPAYHNAREAINNTHKKNECFVLFNSETEKDIFVNTMLNTSILLSNGQSHYQKYFQLMTELINPLFDDDSMESDGFSDIFELMQNKSKYVFFNTNNKSINVKCLYDQILLDFEPFYIFSDKHDNKFVLSSTLKKGLSGIIANITNTSRQNIENVFKAGNISEIRNIDTTLLLYLNSNYVR